MGLSKTQLRDIARALKVTDHSDYRAFLALVYAEAKARDVSYSYVKLSRDLGVGSTNAHSVISGRRPLTLKAAEKVCEALHLTGVQKRYFLTLVQQERARSIADRDEAFDQRMALRQRVMPSEMESRQLAFFEHWYHAAVLEILRLESAQDSEEWLAEHIRPEVPTARVRESLALLQELGYVRYDQARRRLFPTDATITTGNEVLGLALMSFHRQMLKIAMEAVETVPREERDISAVTLSVSPALRDQFKDEIIALRKRFLKLSAEETDASEVMQVNFQMFPLMKRKD
jgi:uncharacterized protein (TIGR02147 family)